MKLLDSGEKCVMITDASDKLLDHVVVQVIDLAERVGELLHDLFEDLAAIYHELTRPHVAGIHDNSSRHAKLTSACVQASGQPSWSQKGCGDTALHCTALSLANPKRYRRQELEVKASCTTSERGLSQVQDLVEGVYVQ